jgi:hypothetical protein
MGGTLEPRAAGCDAVDLAQDRPPSPVTTLHWNSRFLEKSIGLFVDRHTLPFSYEIAISNNASTDDRAAVVEADAARSLSVGD